MKLTLVNFESQEEINLDSDNPNIIGRGTQFGCFDKKVSRNHGQLKLTPDGNVQLIALHSNPCFIMKNGLPPIIPLTKNDEKILSNGDYIGLLPDSFWFKVVVNKNESTNIPNSNLNGFESDSETKKDCNLATTKIPTLSDSDGDHSKESQPSTLEKEIHSASVPDNSENVAEKVNSNDSLEERLKALEHTKKLPVYMYEIDDFPEESVSTNVNESSNVVKEEEEEVSEQCKTKENEECVNADPVTSSTSDNNSQSHGQVEIHNPEDNQEDLNTPKVNLINNAEIRENIPHTSRGQTVSEENKNGNCSKAPDRLDSKKRLFCQYEGRCYRKNDQHKRDFSHPGDPDFVPYENRPMCEFGSSCYRQNKSHHSEYRHPKKKLPATDSPKGKRRKKEAKYRFSSDEDDYDLEDPFINDGSSDEFIPSDFESDDDMEDFS